MKKNIIIVILILISATFVVYAKIKATEAENAHLQLSETIQMAQRQSEEAAKHQELALNAAAEAVKRKREAELALADLQECRSK